jgi:hypothetical protein
MTVPSVSSNEVLALKVGWCSNGCQVCENATLAQVNKTISILVNALESFTVSPWNVPFVLSNLL